MQLKFIKDVVPKSCSSSAGSISFKSISITSKFFVVDLLGAGGRAAVVAVVAAAAAAADIGEDKVFSSSCWVSHRVRAAVTLFCLPNPDGSGSLCRTTGS